MKYKDITGKILGAAFEVHKFLGNGFQEVIYQRALAHELYRAGLKYKRKVSVDIFYKDLDKPIGRRRADILVEGQVLIEIKAVSAFKDEHWAQTINYLKAYKFEVGLLINFGSKSMEFKRFVLTQK